jgi:hypothetical protein
MIEHSQVPMEFHPFFWDVHMQDLNVQQHQRFIIERLLNEGDHHTLQWIFDVYTLDEIRDSVCLSRGLSKKTARYWQYFFQLNEEEMRCFGMLSMKQDKLF